MVRDTSFNNGGHVFTHKLLIMSIVSILLKIAKNKSSPNKHPPWTSENPAEDREWCIGITCRQRLFNSNRISLSLHIYFMSVCVWFDS